MAKPKLKINLFDLLVIIAILIISVVSVFSWNNEPYLGSRNMIVTVKIIDENTIENIVSKLDENQRICIDSNRYCATQNGFEFVDDYLLVKISGIGDINGDRSIFLGKKIYANQEVKLRGNYTADGFVVDYYENK